MSPIHAPSQQEDEFDDEWTKGIVKPNMILYAREEPAEEPEPVDRLLALAGEAEVYRTPEGTAYADLPIEGHRETWPLRGAQFRRWLAQRYHGECGKLPSGAALASALNLNDARALFGPAVRPVHLRVAAAQGRIYLDLADAAWRAVEIGPEGWRVVEDPPVRFRRPAGMLPLPAPEPGGSLAALRELCNLADNSDLILAGGWLLAALHEGGPYPVLILAGEPGSAKSTCAAMLRSLIDPHAAPLRALPRRGNGLAGQARDGHILAFDNVSGFRSALSDELCRLATGGGFALPRTAQNPDVAYFDAARPVLLNGIDSALLRPDLADRSILIELAPIEPARRRSRRDLAAAFERERPRVLGALLDAAALGLRQRAALEFPGLPRMADFWEWIWACETALAPEGGLQEACNRNRFAVILEAIEAEPVAAALHEWVFAEDGEWNGTASHLLQFLRTRVGWKATSGEAWPQSPRGLAARLRRMAPFLRSLGVEVRFERDATPQHNRMVTIVKLGKELSQRSEPSEPSPRPSEPARR